MVSASEETTTPIELLGEAPPSPAGPLEDADAGLGLPPTVALPSRVQLLRFGVRQIEFVFGARRRLGDVFRFATPLRNGPTTLTCHPDHVASLMRAKPDLVPTLTAESALRPVVGPASVLTANGPRHLRQRRLLLPPFHGEAVAAYGRMIADAAEAEIDRWPVGRPLALAPRMQAITLDVIMGGIFGIEGKPAVGTPEHGLRTAVRAIVETSTWPLYQVDELLNSGRSEATGLTRAALGILDRLTFAVIAKRRAASDLEGRHDVLSMLLQARTEDGEALTDQELRDELLTLVLAGHETTANQLAWAWERLVRAPEAQERLVAAVRDGGEEASKLEVEAVIREAMRSRPVIPMVGRRVTVPWRLGDFAVPADSPVTMSVLLLHHREDLYPEPFAFRPERWHGVEKPGTYTWLPFGGGTRRCLGATLAMAEMRIVLEAMARRLDLAAVDAEPERAVHRNVTMIPRHGARVLVRARR